MGETPDLRLNHVAFTVPRAAVSESGRQRIVDFFCGCLGFARPESIEGPGGEYLAILRCRDDQHPQEVDGMYFVFLGHDEPATAHPGHGGDHVGITCSSLEQFLSIKDRVNAYLAKYGGPAIDDQVRELPGDANKQAGSLYAFYVQPFDAPIAIEVQYPASDGGLAANATP